MPVGVFFGGDTPFGLPSGFRHVLGHAANASGGDRRVTLGAVGECGSSAPTGGEGEEARIKDVFIRSPAIVWAVVQSSCLGLRGFRSTWGSHTGAGASSAETLRPETGGTLILARRRIHPPSNRLRRLRRLVLIIAGTNIQSMDWAVELPRWNR